MSTTELQAKVGDAVILQRLEWRGWNTPFLFFTGKGGVGKTTAASATALSLADDGRRVLLVSTDPASNLGDVFQMRVDSNMSQVPGVPGLSLLNIDPHEAANTYRARVLAPYQEVLPGDELRALEEQLSGACTVEIAAFDEFTRLLADPKETAQFDHIVFDTAPTGHTLRLLSLPSAWSGFIETNSRGASCLGPLAGLEAQQARYVATVGALADPGRTTLVLVSRAENGALREAARAGEELANLGITNQLLLINGVFAAITAADPVAEAITEQQRKALGNLPRSLRGIRAMATSLTAADLIGVPALRAWTHATSAGSSPVLEPVESPSLEGRSQWPGLEHLINTLEAEGPGVIMTMGKGGVGKTTIAATIASELARRGHQVHLSTTDPADHLGSVLADERPVSLTVTRIDPVVETERYAQEVIKAAGELDEESRALLEEDMRSPCTEEIAVFRAFSRTLARARTSFVVLDTAPTGHTLLLLDTTGAYHNEILRNASQLSGRLTTPLMRLQDPSFARILVVTLPESTPVLEAERLQADLRRAGIEPFGWVINQSLTTSGTRHPLLKQRARREINHLRYVSDELANRLWVVPWSVNSRIEDSELRAPNRERESIPSMI